MIGARFGQTGRRSGEESPLRRWSRKVAILILACGVTAPAAPSGQAVAAQEPLISNVFIDTELRQALQDIGLQAQMPIIAGPTVTGLVTADLIDVPLVQALDIVLAGTEFRAARLDGYWLVYDADPQSPGFRRVSRTEVVELDHISGTSLEQLLPQVYRPFVNIDKTSSLVVVQADSSLGAEIVRTIERVDVPRRHVLLDARVVVIEQSRLKNIGFEWTWPGAEAGAFTGKDLDGVWPWQLGIGLSTGEEFTNALMLNLDLLKQNDEASILSSPQVVSQSGKSAEIKVATEEYFKITTNGIYERLQLEKIETGTTLNITPVVGDEGTITLDVAAEVSDVIARGSDNLPVVNRRTAQSTIRLQDGGTAAIAGLLATRQRQAEARVPILGSLPLVGALFRKHEGQNVSKQLAIFITARLLTDDGEMLAAADLAPRPVPLVDEGDFRWGVRQALDLLHGEGGR